MQFIRMEFTDCIPMQLGIGAFPEEGKMVVKLLRLREEDEEKIHEIVWVRLGN